MEILIGQDIFSPMVEKKRIGYQNNEPKIEIDDRDDDFSSDAFFDFKWKSGWE